MFRPRTTMGLLTLILLFALASPFTSNNSVNARQAAAQSQFEIVFPDDATFPELETKLQEKSKLTGSAWVEEFKKQPILARVRTSTGLQGTLFPNSVATINVLTGQVPFILYGTIEIPAGAKLGQKDFSGSYGIVLFSEPFVIALIDLTTGDVKAFVVVPAQGQTIPLFSLPLSLFSPLWVFQVLASLITVAAPAPPAPVPPPAPQLPAPSCPKELPNKSNVNLPLNAAAAIISAKDSSGAALFEVSVTPPGSLTVQSFGASLQFTYTTALERRLGFIIGPGSQSVSLSVEVPFVLFVTNGTKSACLEATPKLANGVVTLTGTLSTN
ncbi:MAG: hypothetical protein A2Z21_10355 [Candidatus Fraserbacteria bacterium RBG_16_55_9]|uniref:Uncharacterized protein n=1 Tax=Fraserbacteria sp. (strain RBG_16_55_9) TaxID=1817864 RepID=A0A1F5URR3_FRAXR|nr:MAG: hypothetical protein A2Z21_10355 [Candidatus Fraserbacteria bacterium RBG_16_55_9]